MGKRSREKQEKRMTEANQGSTEILSRRSRLEKIYLTIIQWGVYLTLLTPFIFIKDYFFPFVVPKTIFFRTVVDLIFIAYILLAVSNPKYRLKFNALTVSLTVFLGVIILTSLTGVNFMRSFWSTFERMTGILTFLHLYVFFIILSSVFKERKHWERILSVSILVGVLICIYTLTANDSISRGGGTLGNSSFLSAYLVFNIIFAIILLVLKSWAWRIFYGVSLIIFLSTLLFNPGGFTKGAVSALAAGIFIVGFGYLMFYLLSSKSRILKRLFFVLIILIILAGFGFSRLNFTKEKINTLWQSGSVQSRLLVWQTGWRGWQEKFFLGWGQENFNIPFAKYFNPALPLTFDVWYDRVHNVVLDTAVTSGVLGLLSYLSVFAVAIFKLLKISFKVIKRKNVFIPLGMITLLLVYFLQDIWVFDMVSSYLMFFLSLAFVNFLILSSNDNAEIQPSQEKKRISFSPFFGALLIIASLLAVYFGNIQPARASRYTVSAMAGSLENSLPLFQKAINLSPMSIFEVPEQFAKKMSSFVFDEKQNKEVLKNGFELAAEEVKKSIEKNPEDYRLYLLLGRYYNDFFYLTQDVKQLESAEKYLTKAIELSPKNQQTYWSLAQTKIYQGKIPEGVDLIKKTVDLEPRYGQAHWFLALAYGMNSQFDLASAQVKIAEKNGYNWKGNSNDLQKVIEIYQQLRDNQQLIELYPLAIKLDSKNARLYAGFAVANANLGKFADAKNLGTQAKSLSPDASFTSEISKFLDSLPK